MEMGTVQAHSRETQVGLQMAASRQGVHSCQTRIRDISALFLQVFIYYPMGIQQTMRLLKGTPF